MEIPINAEVSCHGTKCGTVVCVIVEPIHEKMTHFVVKESHFPYIERLVSLKHILSSDSESIILGCTAEELSDMEQFIEYEFVRGEEAHLDYSSNGYWRLPLSAPDPSVMRLLHENMPVGETALHQGAKVFARDGHVGKLDEFLIDSQKNGRITHIVLREGHLWGAKNVTVPVAEITRTDEEGIHLSLSKDEIEKLPSLKATGWFG